MNFIRKRINPRDMENHMGDPKVVEDYIIAQEVIISRGGEITLNKSCFTVKIGDQIRNIETASELRCYATGLVDA